VSHVVEDGGLDGGSQACPDHVVVDGLLEDKFLNVHGGSKANQARGELGRKLLHLLIFIIYIE
jgi:hypothetical protein